MLKSYQGPTPLLLFVMDPQTGYKIEFKSKKYQVRICTDFIDELDRLGLTYKLSRK